MKTPGTSHQLEIKDLQQGDVLLFEADLNDCVSWAITFCSKAPVSHAAICYDVEKGLIVDAAGEFVRTAELCKYIEDKRPVHVCRMNPSLSKKPVLDAAQTHLDRKDPYAFSTLWMVSFVILYENYRATSSVQKAIARFLEAVCARLITAVNHRQYGDKTPMVCSQFVAQCYEEAGSDYKLTFKRAVDANGALGGASLLEQVIKAQQNTGFVGADSAPYRDEAPQIPPTNDIMDWACKLLRKLVESSKNAVDLEQPTAPEPELMAAVNRFCLLHAWATGAVEKRDDQNIPAALQQVQGWKNYFITPGDLLLHCPSLERVGVIQP